MNEILSTSFILVMIFSSAFVFRSFEVIKYWFEAQDIKDPREFQSHCISPSKEFKPVFTGFEKRRTN
jgi:hypothetical protein